jgi:hypothetical protein
MPWTVAEFANELERDPTRRVLFVEGNRDVVFWKVIVPTMQRGDTVIYPISEILADQVDGGERGRLIWYARTVAETLIAGRVSFFADADNDRILQIPLPENVTLTDGRDLESYALSECCMIRLGLQGIGTPEHEAATLLSVVVAVTRPIGVLRIMAARKGIGLAFQRTLRESRIRRFLQGDYLGVTLDVDRLLSTLLQNSNISLARKDDFSAWLAAETERCRRFEDNEIIHGKDFVAALASIFGMQPETMEKLALR